jgi:hypothetical protein
MPDLPHVLPVTRVLIAGCLALGLLSACEESSAPVAPTTQVGPAELHNADAPVDGSLLAQALNICLTNMPDVGAARQAMILAGFRQEGRFGPYDFYSGAGQKVLAIFSVGDLNPRCGVGRDGLRDAAAVQFAENALRRAYGVSFQPVDPAEFDTSVLAGWLASLPTGPVAVAVTPAENFQPIFLGSLIIVTSDVTQTDEK